MKRPGIKGLLRWEHLVLTGYTALTAWSVIHHEPWRDEAQAWLIARDVPLVDLFRQANYEGSPVLWHLILKPFSALGAPYITMHWIHLLIAGAAGTIALFKSPLGRRTKLALVFSYFLFWEYAVIARNYSVSILLLFLIAASYPSRRDTPVRFGLLLFLLFNTNVHGIFPALAVSMVFVFEALKESRPTLRQYAAFAIIVAGALAALLQLLPAPDNINRELFHIFSWKTPIIALGNAFFPLIPRTAYLTLLAASMLVALFSVVLFFRSKPALFILPFSYLGLFYVFVFKHTGTVRHHGLLLMILLFAVWISKTGQDEKKYYIQVLDRIGIAAITLCLVLSSFFAARHHIWEYRRPFSGAKDAAAFLSRRFDSMPVLVAHPSIKASAMAPYLPRARFWYADIQDFGTYITWNTRYQTGKDIGPAEVLRRAGQAFGSEADLVFILDAPLPDSLAHDLDLIYRTEGDVFGYGEETFYMYRTRSIRKQLLLQQHLGEF